MSYNQEQENINPSNEEAVGSKKTAIKVKRKKVDEFTELTNKIILKEGFTVREFEKNAIHEARVKLREKFVAENIHSLL